MGDRWKVSLFFLISTIVCSLCFGLVNRYLVGQALQQDAEILLYQFHESLTNARNTIDKYGSPTNFECNDELREQLNSDVYTHSSIRRLGSAIRGVPECSTKGPKYKIASLTTHHVSDDYSLVSALDDEGSLDELLLIKTEGDRQLFASLSPFLVEYLDRGECEYCLSYEIVIEGEPALSFSSRDIESSYVELSVNRVEESLNVTLKLVANREFYDSYAQFGWVSTFLFSFVVSFFMAIVFRRFLSSRRSLRALVEEGVGKSEFIPYYQPIVDSRTGEIIGAEVLVRWRKSHTELVPPNQFIPFVEDSGLIVPITEQLVKKVMQDILILGWQEGTKFMSINIVPTHLESFDLADLLESESAKHKIDLKAISLEITERKVISDLSEARIVLDYFRGLGVKIKLDDAGTGYGGFSYVQELGLSTLKIDKMFTDTIDTDDVKNSVLDAIISFAQVSELDVIAEGVESEKQVCYLQSKGVHKMQGYFFAKPMPANDLILWIEGNLEFQKKAWGSKNVRASETSQLDG